MTIFASWLEATSTGNQALADFYAARFRPEFAPAFEAWSASRPIENPEAAASPFDLPEYKVAALERAARLEQEAARHPPQRRA